MPSHHQASVVHHPDFRLYNFGEYHPLRPERIDAGLALLREAGIWYSEDETLCPDPAENAELELVHGREYIAAVEQAGREEARASAGARFGLVSTDNPPFPNMHYASSLVAGGAVAAIRAVMAGDLDHVFHPAGGLHHAGRERASGFCIYNDPAVAAAVAAREFGARVLYIDLDCHHGDGVQWIFYDDPAVFTLSFHESGRFLFPGTGDITEVGAGAGMGFSLNVPFYPFTRDDSWRVAIDAILPGVTERFRPDVIISNHGCDTHHWDPLTHLSLTTRSFDHQARLVHQLAHAHCDGRWLAVGSGGYDWRRVVPRSWSILWAEMTERVLPKALPTYWSRSWLAESDIQRPERFIDDESILDQSEYVGEVAAVNQATIENVSSLVSQIPD